MGCSAEYLRFQLVCYMQTYIKGVKIVGERLLAAKGLAAEILLLTFMNKTIKETNCLCTSCLGWCKTTYVSLVMTIFGTQVTVKQQKLISAAISTALSFKPALSSGKEYELEGKVVYDLAGKKGAPNPWIY